ncbi:MAG: hypothetical protein M1419_05490 [Bacteroidetes bacterium]|nr:hypothetical protein [Bacteroidota bacterium]
MKNNKRYIIIISTLFFSALQIVNAATYTADPGNYLTYRDLLAEGDTLMLTPGNYTNGLRLNNKNGTENNWIVIKSEVPHEAVLLGRDGSNTMDITDCSYIKIEGLKFDGQKIPYIDAIKASGSASNWSHHIWIHNNIITGHDSTQQTCGVSTKITSWDWTISHNKIMSAGTGIYLGNSDGSMPFIRGIIEYNLILNPVGYCMQIKHQNVRPDLPGIPTQPSSTIVRHNVFTKNDRPSPDGDRPNVLFGGQTIASMGSNDRVECYGNFFYNNPNEYLLQATGNVSVHDNIFVNSPLGAMNFQPHNSRNPKEVFIYSNSIYNVGTGIRITNPVPTEKQIILANAIFAYNPISAESAGDNLTGRIDEADTFFINPDSVIQYMDFYPKPNAPKADVDFTLFMVKDTDYDKDFNGNPQDFTSFGAYSGEGTNPGWKLALDIKGSGVTNVEENNIVENGIKIYPNPALNFIKVSGVKSEVVIYNLIGYEEWRCYINDFGIINFSGFNQGMYILKSGNVINKFMVTR